MKEAIVSPDLSIKIIDSPIPKPGPGQVLIKVICAGFNPKDWKYPFFTQKPGNTGDDIAGEVAEVGEDVFEFKPGDKVAAFHEMTTSGGAFAEYAIAPASTTFHLPKKTSFEEASTIPLAALTSVVALYHNLALPQPWEPAKTKIPLIIYGGSTAIGLFAIKLAVRSNIHPLIVVAGRGRDVVEPLLSKDRRDAIIDYRDGTDAVVKGIQEALKAADAGPAYHAYDCVSEPNTYEALSRVLDPNGHITLVLPGRDYTSIPESLKTSVTYVGVAHTDPLDASTSKGIRHFAEGDGRNGKDLCFVFSRYFGRGLQEGWFTGHPTQILPGGLNDVSTALKNLKDGKASAVKYVIRPGDTASS